MSGAAAAGPAVLLATFKSISGAIRGVSQSLRQVDILGNDTFTGAPQGMTARPDGSEKIEAKVGSARDEGGREKMIEICVEDIEAQMWGYWNKIGKAVARVSEKALRCTLKLLATPGIVQCNEVEGTVYVGLQRTGIAVMGELYADALRQYGVLVPYRSYAN